MSWFRAWRIRLRSLFHGGRVDDEMAAELRFHLDQQIEENRAVGMSTWEARRAALIAFGNPVLVEEDARAVWRWRWVDVMARDFAYGLRSLRRTPAFSLMAVATLALGIGTTTAMFSVAYSVLLRPLPYTEAESIVLIQSRDRTTGQLTFSGFSGPELHDWTERTRSFETLALGALNILAVDGESGYETLSGATVSEQFFDVFGKALLLGRGLTVRRADEAVISYGLWQRQFGAASDVLGRRIRLNGDDYTIVGVAQSDFDLPRDMRRLSQADAPDVWIPPGRSAAADDRRFRSYHLVGRLRAGVTIDSVQAEAENVAAAVAKEFSSGRGIDPVVMSRGPRGAAAAIACGHSPVGGLGHAVGRSPTPDEKLPSAARRQPWRSHRPRAFGPAEPHDGS